MQRHAEHRLAAGPGGLDPALRLRRLGGGQPGTLIAPALAGWPAFLEQARALENRAVMPPVAPPAVHGRPWGHVRVLAPAGVAAGAIADLQAFDAAVGRGPRALTLRCSLGLPGPAESYRLAMQHGRLTLKAHDAHGLQNGLYRLLQLAGARYFEPHETVFPPRGEARLPAEGFVERWVPRWTVRGFAPHLYHPLPLSVAFHEPSAAHLQEVCGYLDWLARNRQNTVKFELLNLDAPNRYLPCTPDHRRFQAWLPHARAILAHAHALGIQVSLNVAFANDVSNNEYAINPLLALADSLRLDGEERRGDPRYARDLAGTFRSHRRDLHALLDRLMQAPWDDVSWCLGTSEFSSTNDDLTIAWMNEAAAYLGPRGATTSVISHVPSRPFSPKHRLPYFQLPQHAGLDVGVWVHTTELYGFTDPAPVYGNASFEHQLRQLYESDPRRRVVYEPESSYWVSYDASVPLFLPVYMLSRARDLAILKRLPNVRGQVVFSTASEWGYWLTDYVVAQLQADPDLTLTQALTEALGPAAAGLLIEVMAHQQHGLITRGLIKDVQGQGFLTDLGAALLKVPGVNGLLEGTNSSPLRTPPAAVMAMDRPALDDFERRTMLPLMHMRLLASHDHRHAVGLRGQVPAHLHGVYDELVDALAIQALRVAQVEAATKAACYLRESQLRHEPAWRAMGEERLRHARLAIAEARKLVRAREARYRTPPAETYGRAAGPTMWPDRVLTPVHTLAYWLRTYDEVAKLYGP